MLIILIQSKYSETPVWGQSVITRIFENDSWGPPDSWGPLGRENLRGTPLSHKSGHLQTRDQQRAEGEKNTTLKVMIVASGGRWELKEIS